MISSIACVILLLPRDLHNFFKTEIGAELFSSNIIFWRESGYFDVSSEFKPLIHTWSLSVEEQFYILFPFFIAVFYRGVRSTFFYITRISVAISLSISICGMKFWPAFTFCMAPTRAWEPLVGSLLAIGFVPVVKSRAMLEGLTFIGLGLIASAVYLYSSETLFPGTSAIVPVLGAALIIYASPHTTVGLILSLRPMVFIGLISYSLYLWHWPIFVLTRYYLVDALSGQAVFALIVVSLLLATLSWKFIETPFRDKDLVSRHHLFAGAAVASFILLSAGVGGVISRGRVSPAPARVTYLENFKHDVSPRRGDCHRGENRANSEIALPQSCVFGVPAPPHFAV